MPTSHQARLHSLTLSLALLGASTAWAQAGLYVDVLPEVKGQSKAVGHKDWIDATSLQFSASRVVSTDPGRGASSTVSLSDLTWTQALDTSVPQLLGQMYARNPRMADAQIDVVSPLGAASGSPTLAFKLERAALTGIDVSNAQVSASLSYDKIALDYAGLGKRDEKTSIFYDLKDHSTSTATARAPDSELRGGAPAAGLYLRLGSGTHAIAGDNASAGYENWIALDTYKFGVGLDATQGGRSRPSMSEITVSESFDGSMPYALGALLRGTDLGQATIEYVTDSKNGPVTFMQIVLADVIVSGLSLATGGGLPNVTESLSFGRFMQTVWDVDADGGRSKPRTFAYDVPRGKTIDPFTVENVNGFGAGNLLASAAAGGSLPGSAAPPAPVPEPASALLMLAGAGLLLCARRRLGHPRH